MTIHVRCQRTIYRTVIVENFMTLFWATGPLKRQDEKEYPDPGILEGLR